MPADGEWRADAAPYGMHPRHHLARARARLDEGSPEALFYAALELRFGIEARYQQYLDAQGHRRVKSGWRLQVLDKKLECYFKTGDKVIRISLHWPDGRKYVLTYTPVTRRLRQMGERLGTYLHAPSEYHGPSDPWWDEFRSFAEEVYRELEKAVSGNLLGAPLRDPGEEGFRFATEPLPGETLEQHKNAMPSVNDEVMAHVEYLDCVPEMDR